MYIQFCENDEINSVAETIPAILIIPSTKNIKRRTALQEELKESLQGADELLVHVTTGLAHENARCSLEVRNDI